VLISSDMATINDKPCSTCEHFDPVMRGQTAKGGVRETNWAWCAVRSKYPAKEGPGQRFPMGVQRVEEGASAEPYIVKRGQTVANCDRYTAKTVRMSKADLLKQLQEQTGGRIIGS
jgi:hypothetical protein